MKMIMKKSFCGVFLAVFLILACSITPAFCTYAADQVPTLSSISFKNAEVVGEFDSEKNEYQIVLTDNTVTPTLDSYAINGNAQIFVEYITDESERTTGICVTLQYENGTHIYNFYYSNLALYTVNSNNFLADIYCNLGELDQEVSHDTNSYKMYIPSDLTQLTITPVTEDANAYCPSVNLTLNEGQTQKLQLYSIASDGSKREYSLELKRVDKTVEQVKDEMSRDNYTSFVDGTKLYQKTEFLVVLCCAAAGILVISVLYVVTKRISVNPYDPEEKPFYRTE